MREERLHDPHILKQSDKVEVVYNPELDKGYKERWKAAVNIEIRNGNYKVQRSYAKGDLQNPFTEEELKAKFKRSASGVLDYKGTEEIINAILQIEALPQVGQLTALIKQTIQQARA